jgi:hypothetical protein
LALTITYRFDITWAGKTYANVGDGKPVDAKTDRPGQVTLDCTNGCSVDVPGPGLAVVYIGGAAEEKPSGTSSSLLPSGTNSSSDKKNTALRVCASGFAMATVLLSVVFLS